MPSARPRPCPIYLCTRGVGPAGERYRTVTNVYGEGPYLSAERTVDVLRADGSWHAVYLSADPPTATFALTAEQQQRVALDPAIALDPVT